jgi:hypothetical protein
MGVSIALHDTFHPVPLKEASFQRASGSQINHQATSPSKRSSILRLVEHALCARIDAAKALRVRV